MALKILPLAAMTALLPALSFAQEDMGDPATTNDAVAPAVVTLEVGGDGFVPFKCPIERIRSAYQDLVDPEDTLVALAIEKQTLAICRQSQEALIRIAENEARLAELFEPIIAPPPPPPAPAPEPEPEPEPVIELVEPEPEPEPLLPPEPEFVPPDFALAAVMKDPMGFKAMIVDGAAIYTVREGDRMDDGSTVISIDRGRVEFLSKDNHSFTLD